MTWGVLFDRLFFFSSINFPYSMIPLFCLFHIYTPAFDDLLWALWLIFSSFFTAFMLLRGYTWRGTWDEGHGTWHMAHGTWNMEHGRLHDKLL